MAYDGSRTGDLLGRMFDRRYRVNELIGSGGMGSVYRATHMEMNREVALKVLERGVADTDKQVQRFYQEARASSRLQHPNTIRVFDFGRAEDGRVYLAMEYLRGETLTELLRRTPNVDVGRICRMLRQVCKSLAEAHQAGIVHRDLKPDNIFITDIYGENDFVKVLDFGIAKSTEGEEMESLTQTGFICGTPRYLSPEQAMGKDIDARSDLYSLGVILYEMIAGKPPFVAATPIALVMKHIHEKPPRLDSGGNSKGRWISDLAWAMMQKAPSRRPDSAVVVAQALTAIETGQEPVGVLPAPRPKPRAIVTSANLRRITPKKASKSLAVLPSPASQSEALATALLDSSEMLPAPSPGVESPSATLMLQSQSALPALEQLQAGAQSESDLNDSEVILLNEEQLGAVRRERSADGTTTNGVQRGANPDERDTEQGVMAGADPDDRPTQLSVAMISDQELALHEESTRLGVPAMSDEAAASSAQNRLDKPRLESRPVMRRASATGLRATRKGDGGLREEYGNSGSSPLAGGEATRPNVTPLEANPMTRVMKSPLSTAAEELPMGSVRRSGGLVWLLVALTLVWGGVGGFFLWYSESPTADDGSDLPAVPTPEFGVEPEASTPVIPPPVAGESSDETPQPSSEAAPLEPVGDEAPPAGLSDAVEAVPTTVGSDARDASVAPEAPSAATSDSDGVEEGIVRSALEPPSLLNVPKTVTEEAASDASGDTGTEVAPNAEAEAAAEPTLESEPAASAPEESIAAPERGAGEQPVDPQPGSESESVAEPEVDRAGEGDVDAPPPVEVTEDSTAEGDSADREAEGEQVDSGTDESNQVTPSPRPRSRVRTGSRRSRTSRARSQRRRRPKPKLEVF